MDKKRLRFVDEARGLAMLVVMSWHIIGVHSHWTDSWTMPIFFFVMGLFYKQELSVRKLMVKKLNTLIVPLIFCSIPALVISLYNHGWINTLKEIVNPYGCINPCSWFLVCIFFCYVIYWGINKIANSINQRIFCSLIVSLIGFYSSQFHIMGHRIVFPLFISTAMTMIFMIESGRLMKNMIVDKNWGGSLWMQALLIILFVLLTLIFTPAPQNMIWSEYGTKNYVLYFALSFTGSTLILLLCYKMEYILKCISVFGRLSLLLLILHSYVHMILDTLVENVYSNYILTSILTLVIAYIIDKYMPIVTGKEPIFKY